MTAPKLKIALVQSDTVWEDPAANLQKLRRFSIEAARAGARVVAFSEMCLTGYTMSPARYAEPVSGPVAEAFSKLARELGVWIIASVIEKHSPRPRNVCLALSPEGHLAAAYRKIHPFSFGLEDRHYMGGDELPIFEIDGVPTTLQICYDLRFPEPLRIASAAGAQLVFVPANWPTRRLMHWSTLLAARAIENQMVVCGINRVGNDPLADYPGYSAIHDAQGEIVAFGNGSEGLVIGEVDFEDVCSWRAQFPAQRDRRSEVYARLRRS